jgi:FkbM family methyltransferase
MIYNRLHIDVGANDGKAAIHYARFEPLTKVIAFEPIPELVERIKVNSSNLSNFEVIQSAVSDYEGESVFNVSPPHELYGDYACSSLLDFSDKSKTEWVGREDFKVIDKIKVKIIRLDNFFISNNITQVDYLKIDTQGLDLNVLKGCGDLISIIHSGEMEAGTKEDVLYDGQNTKDESINFLESIGFEIVQINSNDVHTNEVNIVFRNKFPKKASYKKVYELLNCSI